MIFNQLTTNIRTTSDTLRSFAGKAEPHRLLSELSYSACCATPIRSKINRIGQRPIVSDNHSVKPCKGVIVWISGFQPVERDVAVFTGHCPVLLNTRLSALKYSCTTALYREMKNGKVL